jgi:hypothetical protein
MTDDEARDVLHEMNTGTPMQREAIYHALTALTDREALVEALAVHVYGSRPSPTTESFLAARRHMRGEP